MHDRHLFEYALIRVVPRVERGEFLNEGVVLFCKKLDLIACSYHIDAGRLLSLYDQLDIPQLEEYLKAFRSIAEAQPNAGPIAALDTASRFRWLTATRSTIIQTSPVHPAFCTDPAQALEKLMQEFVV